MAPSLSIDGIIFDLRSDKVKTREQGVADLRSYLSDPTHRRTALERGDEDPKYWLGIFQALFSAVLEERKVVIKKGIQNCQLNDTRQRMLRFGFIDCNQLINAALRLFFWPGTPMFIQRLTRAGSAVRWLVQLTAAHLSRKVVKAVLAHLTQTLESKGTLFSPVSLDYIKALETLFAHPAHRDGLDPKDWEGLIRLSFAGIFGEDLEQFGALGVFSKAEADGEDWILASGSAPARPKTPAPSAKGKERMIEDMDVDELEDDDQDDEDESELASTIQKVSTKCGSYMRRRESADRGRGRRRNGNATAREGCSILSPSLPRRSPGHRLLGPQGSRLRDLGPVHR